MSFDRFWGIALVALPLFHRVIWGPRLSQQFGFLFLTAISLLCFGMGKLPREFPRKSLLLILCLTFVNQHNPASIHVMMQTLCVYAGVALFTQFVTRFKNIDVVLNFMVIGCLIQSLWVFLESVNISPFYEFIGLFGKFKRFYSTVDGYMPYDGRTIIAGSFSHHNLTGAYIAMMIPAFFRGKLHLLLPIPLIALFLLDCSLPIVTMIAACSVYLALKRNISLETIIVVGVVGSLTLFLLSQHTEMFAFFDDNGRTPVWKEAIAWINGTGIIWGEGVGYFHDKFPLDHPHIRPKFLQAHNEYIEIYVAYGIIGLMLFFRGLRVILLKRQNPLLMAILFAVLVNMVGNFTLHVPGTALVALIIYSFLFQGGNNGVFSKQGKFRSFR